MKGKIKPCHPCSMGKATNKTFKSHFDGAKYAGEIVQSDLGGPFPKSHSGSNFSFFFINQFSRFCHVVGHNFKSNEVDAIGQFNLPLPQVQNYFKTSVE